MELQRLGLPPRQGTAVVGPSPSFAPTEVVSPLQVIGVQDASPLAWAAEGDVLAAVSSNHSIFIFALCGQAFKLTKLLAGHHATVKTLVFHPHDADMLVSGGVEGIFVWSISTGRVTQVISHLSGGDLAGYASVVSSVGGHESDIECMCWAHDGTTLITGSKDTNVKAWSVSLAPNSQSLLALTETITGHKGPILCVAFCPKTSRLASAGRDSSIKIWDASTLAPDWRPKVTTPLSPNLPVCLGLTRESLPFAAS